MGSWRPNRPRIVVGVDATPAAAAALRWAHLLARSAGGSLEVVHTWTSVPPVHPGGGWVSAPEGWDPRGEARRTLNQVVASVLGPGGVGEDPDVPVKQTVWPGPAGQALVALSEGAEVLVVGTRGHTAVGAVLVGSVSAHCVEYSHCPVLVVHEGMEPPPAAELEEVQVPAQAQGEAA